MKNSNIDYGIDLIEVLRTIFNAKKSIIIVTLAFLLLTFIYTTQKEAEYQSTVFIEIGSYDLLNGEKKLVEPVSSLIKKLKVNLIYKHQLKLDSRKLNFNSIEDQLLEINYTSPSSELNETIINEAITISQESHIGILANMVNSISEKIITIDNNIEFIRNSIENQQESQKLIAINSIRAIDQEVEFLKNSIENQQKSQKNSIEQQQESQKLIAINSIKAIDIKIPALEEKIKYLLKLIPEEENNLLLLESVPSALLQRAASSPTLQQIIYIYNEQAITLKTQIQDLQQEKDTLEMQVKSIGEGEFEFASEELFQLQQEEELFILQQEKELFKLQQEKDTLEMHVKSLLEGEFASEELFKLQQEKDTLEMQIKLVKDQKSTTQPIRELETSEIKTSTLIITLVGSILGFIFSIFIVFIRQAFLKEQN